jgi:hypothetical protein
VLDYSGHNPGKETCHGLALQQKYVETDDYQDKRSGVVWGNLSDPCPNCLEMIWLHGGDTDNFRVDTGEAGAPA